MKLRLSQINLNSEGIIDGLGKVFENNKNLVHLNLSKAQLTPKHLTKITYGLGQHCANMRNLNLSYNYLNFNKEHAMFADSDEFMKKLT